MPGLAENRPSVIVGDIVYVRENTSGGTKQNKKDKEGNKQIVEAGIEGRVKEYEGFMHETGIKRRVKQYEGFIHEVEGERVLLKFHERLVEVIAEDSDWLSCESQRKRSKTDPFWPSFTLLRCENGAFLKRF